MIRLIAILAALGAIGYAVHWYHQLKRTEFIGNMGPDELVDAVIRREISVLEVPPIHRNTVNQLLAEIQRDLDKNDV
jgi:hypothetical protein